MILHEYAIIHLPRDPIRKAIEYSIIRWEKFTVYTRTHHLDPDNNKVENRIQPVAIGRKNYFIAGSLMWHSTNYFFCLLGSVKVHGLEPYSWLKDMLARLSYHPHRRIQEQLAQYYKA